MISREFVHRKTIELGKDVIRMTSAAGSGHPSSALSILHMVTTLMYDVMRWDPEDPWNPANDRLILSQGHAVPAIYAAYADLGGIVGQSRKEAKKLDRAGLMRLREWDSELDGHPNPAEGFPFFDVATGSLGQGLSAAAGLALAARRRSIDRQFYVIIGDGESREGQIWEAMDFVVDYRLLNVVAFFNCNGQGQADYVSGQQSPESLAAKAKAFGWKAVVLDGHDAAAIQAALGDPARREKPLAIIAKTVKGWGCASLTAKTNHGKPVPAGQVEKAIGELDGMYAELGLKRDGGETVRPRKPIAMATSAGKNTPPGPPLAGGERKMPSFGERKMPSFSEAMKAAGFGDAVSKGQVATRKAYGAALLALGHANDSVVALDGDVSNSTYSDIFGKAFPERFFECKIAEQNMVSVGAGLAAGGMVPFVSSFAKFLARAYDQVEMAQITRANLKLVGSHAGISLAADGPSQMGLQDVAYFRCMDDIDNGRGGPICVFVHPSDAVSAFHLTMLMARHNGMCYMRTHRSDSPLLYAHDASFEIGGCHQLVKGDAMTIVGTGYMTHICKEAADRLAQEGIACAVFDAYSFPLNCGPILDHAAKTSGRIFCVEDNYGGGLASAVSEAAAKRGGLRVDWLRCNRIPKSALTPDKIMEAMGLDVAGVAAAVRRSLGK